MDVDDVRTLKASRRCRHRRTVAAAADVSAKGCTVFVWHATDGLHLGGLHLGGRSVGVVQSTIQVRG
jgi:hypothetical protein